MHSQVINGLHIDNMYDKDSLELFWEWARRCIKRKIGTLRNDKDGMCKTAFFGTCFAG